MEELISRHDFIIKLSAYREEPTSDGSIASWNAGIDKGILVAARLNRVDASPVVRCLDCTNHVGEEPGMVYCPNIVGGWVSDSFFCANGKNKEE